MLHVSTFLFLLGTGLLLYAPSLRASLTGGYSLTLLWWHRWGGVAFVLLPLPFLAVVGRAAVFTAENPGRHTPNWFAPWQTGHVLFTVGAAVIFASTGTVMWLKAFFPPLLLEWSRSLHRWFTYGSCLLLACHLFLAVIYPPTRWFFRQKRCVALEEE